MLQVLFIQVNLTYDQAFQVAKYDWASRVNKNKEFEHLYISYLPEYQFFDLPFLNPAQKFFSDVYLEKKSLFE